MTSGPLWAFTPLARAVYIERSKPFMARRFTDSLVDQLPIKQRFSWLTFFVLCHQRTLGKVTQWLCNALLTREVCNVWCIFQCEHIVISVISPKASTRRNAAS